MDENTTTEVTYKKMQKAHIHLPPGLRHKDVNRLNALHYFDNNEELKAIYSLSETHAPTLRIKTSLRFEKNLELQVSSEKTMNKENISFNCPVPIEDSIKNLINKVEEMPKEWTLVQITRKYNAEETLQINISNDITEGLYLSVFNCGEKNFDPFCVYVDAPTDASGKTIKLCKEMQAIHDENKSLLTNHFGDKPLDKVDPKRLKNYNQHRSTLFIRLAEVEKQMENNWLKEWRCLFVGKFLDKSIDKQINEKISSVLAFDKTFQPSKKVLYILHKLVASSSFLTSSEVVLVVNYCIPHHKDLRNKVILMIKTLSNNFNIKSAKRHPVILIVDEKMDNFCWEMMEILQNHPVSRMPSVHFTYALFKEHENTIVNGMKEIKANNGKYIINPGQNLKKMEKRLTNFFKYWLPNWKGIAGEKPTSDEFTSYLLDGDIFIYNGHGSGTEFITGSKIQKLRVNSVVFLFGCGSVRMESGSSLTEMHDYVQNYLIACCPCVVGMIYVVTDFDTDTLSTNLLSKWIPSNALRHWSMIDKTKWNSGTIEPLKSPQKVKKDRNEPEYEPELLRAISLTRKTPSYHITKSAIVARGIPIKIIY